MISRSSIVAAARDWLGTPYLHQASLKGVGTDCLGLVRGVWREVKGVEPEMAPAYSASWAEAGPGDALAVAAARHLTNVPLADFTAGDVLLFRWRPHLPAKHAGIASSESTMIHAQDHAAVTEIALSSWWTRHLALAFRFPGVID